MPEGEDEYYRDLLGEKGNPDFYPDPNSPMWINGDRAVIQRSAVPDLHWSEREKLGYKSEPREPYELGDQMADHSDDQGYDNFKEEE